jgi:hypothetical protein
VRAYCSCLHAGSATFHGGSVGGTYGECGVVVCQVWGFVDVWRGILELGLVPELLLGALFSHQIWKALVFPVVGHISSGLRCRFRSTYKFRVSGDAAETQAATRLLPSLWGSIASRHIYSKVSHKLVIIQLQYRYGARKPLMLTN